MLSFQHSYFLFSTTPECSSCISGSNLLMLNNGVCNTMTNTEECCFDGGDCVNFVACTKCYTSVLKYINPGDNICDLESPVKDMCCFDGLDCLTDRGPDDITIKFAPFLYLLFCPTCPQLCKHNFIYPKTMHWPFCQQH